jgi:RNA polymerase sigma-70 factor (ECF subfamily)
LFRCVTVQEDPHVSANSVPPAGAGDADKSDFAALLDAVRGRDEAAARTLVERLHPIVAKVVQAHLPRREEPEDLYQEIYMKVFTKLDQFRGEAPFEHWVGRLARTTCFDRLRRQKVRPEWRWSDLSEHEQAVFARATAGVEESEAPSAALLLVERILERLPPRDAWLIRSVDLEERPFEDLCAEMNWRVATGRVRLFRARHRLKKAILELEQMPKNP